MNHNHLSRQYFSAFVSGIQDTLGSAEARIIQPVIKPSRRNSSFRQENRKISEISLKPVSLAMTRVKD